MTLTIGCVVRSLPTRMRSATWTEGKKLTRHNRFTKQKIEISFENNRRRSQHLALAAVGFAAPQTFRGNNAKEVAQCTRLLKTFSDTGDWPDAAAPEYIRYDECYYLVCGGTKPEA